MGMMDSISGLTKMLGMGRLNVEQRFDLIRTAVAGTMSKFHMARDRKTGQVVGLKILDVEKTKAFEGRFTGLKKPTEGDIAIKMDHKYVVKTLEHGYTTKGQQYLVMEFLDGQGMNSIVVGKNHDIAKARLNLIRQGAESLAYVHSLGYIHRDVCPRNFMILPDYSTLKLIDFGLSLPIKPEFMQPGNRTGTPLYMAPEIVRRKKTDQRLDIFAFGITAYVFLTFEFPWPTATSSGKAAIDHDTKPPKPILELRPDLDKRLADAVMKCMEVDPANRPSTLDDFLRLISDVKTETA